MANKKTIAGLVMSLSAAFPNWKTNAYTVEVYFQDLQDIPDDELMIAAQACRSQAGRQFAPSTGELRGAVAELRRAVVNLPSPMQAWGEVCRQIVENGGDFGKPVWSNPLIEQVVNSMGWRNLRMSEDPTADRARFIQAFERLSERAQAQEMYVPAVRNYIEAKGGHLLGVGAIAKQLADGMNHE